MRQSRVQFPAACRVAGLAIALCGFLPLLTASGQACTGGGICTDAPLAATDGETPWRYVALQFDGQDPCPFAGGWLEQKVFDYGGGPVPPALQPFCLYEWDAMASRGPAPDPQTILDLISPDGPLVQANPDVMVVSYMGAPLKWQIGESLRDFFLQQADRPDLLPLGGGVRVRLALLDTQPDSTQPASDAPAVSRHGHGLVHSVNELMCAAEPDCNVALTTGLALPFRCASEPACRDNAGGFMGTPVDVAQAVARELLAWDQAGDAARLVMNFSLGWDPLFNECDHGCGASSRVSALAALAALRVASCRGVVMLAAAGNPLPGPSGSTGPLLPGGYETIAAPDFGDCENLLGDSVVLDDNDFPPGERPLVHSVGAVRADSAAIERRDAGEPQLVAFGDHAVGFDGNYEPAATQTGTSVAAAVVAASVAAAWSYRPATPGWQIMDEARGAGIALPRIADYCLGGTCSQVRRVTACRVLQAVCAGGEEDCPPPGSFDCRDPLDREPVLPLDTIAGLFGSPTLDVSELDSRIVPECASPGGSYRVFSATAPSDPCPARQYHGAQATPWAGGQPGNNNCEDCVMRYRSPGTVFIEIDAPFDTESAFLVCTPSPGTTFAYSLGSLGVLAHGARFVVEGLPQTCIDTGVAVTGRIVDATENVAARTPLLINTDADFDGVPADIDNCTAVANENQRDADGDGIGSVCDPDFNNDCIVNFLDLQQMRTAFFSSDPLIDMNGDGSVNFGDLGLLADAFLGAPGPTGPVTSCDPGLHTAGMLELAADQRMDLDNGTITPSGDIWFEHIVAGTSFLAPQGAALHRAVGSAMPERDDCATTVVDHQPLRLGIDIGIGDWACVHTDKGRLGRYQVVSSNILPLSDATALGVEYATWR